MSCSRPEVPVTPPAPEQPLVIGHRGAPGYLPDHTIEGYRLAVAQGADLIEPDLVVTRDGVLIARHENELSQTTDVAVRHPDRLATRTVDDVELSGWFAEDFDLAELREVRAVQPWPSRPHDHDGLYAVPTFDDVLALRAALSEEAGRTIGIIPEMKHPASFAAAGLPLEARVADALRAHGLVNEDAPLIVQSFEPASLDRLAALIPVRRLLLVGELEARPWGDDRTYAELLADLPALRKRVHALGVHKSAVWGPDGPTGLVERAHAAGLEVHVWTFRAEADQLGPAADGDVDSELRRFYALGVDAVFTDQPDRAVAARAMTGRAQRP